MKRTAQCWTLIVLCLSLSLCHLSCQGNGGDGERTTATEGGAVSIPFRFVPQESLPTDSALAEWYAVASEREQVTNAVLTAKDSSSVWHTWICAGDGALTVERITEGEGTDPLVVIHLVSAKERSVQKGLYYVSIFSEGRPSFEVRVDGEDTGVIVTYSETPVAP